MNDDDDDDDIERREQKHCLRKRERGGKKKKLHDINLSLWDRNKIWNWISLTIFLMILNLEMHLYQLYEFDCLEDFYIKY